MKVKWIVLGFCFFFVGNTAFSSVTYYIPQVAIGSFAGPDSRTYVYSTTFVLFNNTTSSSTITLSLTADDGSAMSVNLAPLGIRSTFTLMLGPGETRILQTDTSGSSHAGAATIEATSDIGVSGIYTIKNKSTGQFITEVGVQATALLDHFVIPVQVTANGAVTTGLALYNPGASDSTVTLSLKNADGSSAGATVDIPLAAGKHAAFYIPGKFPSIDHTAFSGMLEVQSTTGISAVTLRQNSPSFDTYTSIPVVPTTSTQTTFNLAHFADGQVGGTPYKTTFMLFNFSTSSATVTLLPGKDDGTTLTLAMMDGSTTAGNYTIEPGASRFLQTDGTANAQGAVIINSTVPIGAAALFTEYNNDQSFNTEAGVQDSPALANFTLPIDSMVSLDGSITTSDTGVAFFNPGALAVSFTPRFLSSTGTITTSATQVSLQAKGHAAYFFNHLFPQLGNIRGSVAVAGLANGISAMTLRLNMSPYNMTTLPVVMGVAPGFPAATSGNPVRKTVTGVVATANTTLNTKLPLGYSVSFTPAIQGADVWSLYGGVGIRAFSGDAIYQTVGFGSAYGADLPPGAYTISAETYVGDQNQAFFWFYTSTDLVTITANATVPVIATFPTRYAVTGNMTGAISSAGTIIFTNSDGSGSYGYNTANNRTYSFQAPSGTYQLAYAVSWPNGPFIPNLGTVTVNGADAIGPDIEIPASVDLSGALSFDANAPVTKTITATNSLSISPFGVNTSDSSVMTTGGSYQQLMVKPGGDPYVMSLGYAIGVGVGSGKVVYTPAGNNPIIVSGQGAYDFTVPWIPGTSDLISISGTVRDAADNPIPGVTVSATTSSLANVTAPGVVFSSLTATTDSSGSYTLSILPGTNYSLSFMR
jgi:hypothetical protein